MNAILNTLMGKHLRRKHSRGLAATMLGSRFLDSPDYEKAIVELVDRDFEPEADFYQLLIGVTACFLCGIDPHREDIDTFDEFISNNMSRISAAIDRVKVSRPQIAYAQEAWVKQMLGCLSTKTKAETTA